jgi:hypothetical protein
MSRSLSSTYAPSQSMYKMRYLTIIGWIPQVFGKDHTLSQASETTVARSLGTSYSTKPNKRYSTPIQQPRASAIAECDLGMPDLFLFEPSPVQLRPVVSLSNTDSTMSGLWHQAANGTRSEGSNSGYVKQAGTRPAPEGHEVWNCYPCTLNKRNDIVSSMHIREPSLLVHMRDLRRSTEHSSR